MSYCSHGHGGPGCIPCSIEWNTGKILERLDDLLEIKEHNMPKKLDECIKKVKKQSKVKKAWAVCQSTLKGEKGSSRKKNEKTRTVKQKNEFAK